MASSLLKRFVTTNPHGVSILPILLCVEFLMLGRTRKQDKVFRSVIVLYSVFVMNSLSWFKIPANFLLYHQAMLVHVSVLMSVWVIWAVNFNISVRVFARPPFPIPVIRAGIVANQPFVPRIIALFCSIPRLWIKTKIFPIARLGAKLFLPFEQLFVAYLTFSHVCYYTQKMRFAQ